MNDNSVMITDMQLYKEYMTSLYKSVEPYIEEFCANHPDVDRRTVTSWFKNEIQEYGYEGEREIGSSHGNSSGAFSINLNEGKVEGASAYSEKLYQYAENVYNNTYSTAKDPISFEASAHLYYNINHVDVADSLDTDSVELFTYNTYGDAGKIVTGDDFTGLQGLYDNYTSQEVSELLQNGQWEQEAQNTIANAELILAEFDNFESQFDAIEGELGAALEENLRLSQDDLRCLKTYVSDNLPKVTEFVEKLKKNLEEQEKLQKELDELEVKIKDEVSKEPPKMIPCQHKKYESNTDEEGYIHLEEAYEHPEGDSNPEYYAWCERIAKLKSHKYELLVKVKVCKTNEKNYLANIQVFNDVVVKYNSSDYLVAYHSNN